MPTCPLSGDATGPWCEVAQAEIRTCNLPIANPALYHTATSAYALLSLWSKLVDYFSQPNHYRSSLNSIRSTHNSSSSSPLAPSITVSLFHSRLKTYLFHKSFPPQTPGILRTVFHGLYIWTFYFALWFLVLFVCFSFSWLCVVDYSGFLSAFQRTLK